MLWSGTIRAFLRLVPDFTFEVSLDEGLCRMIDWYRTTDFPAEDRSAHASALPRLIPALHNL